MKKVIVGIVCIVIVCIAGIYSYRNFSHFSYLGSIKNTITYKKSNNSEISFSVEKGEKVEFTYDSSVKEGTLKFTLTNPSGKVIENFETNKNASKQVSIAIKGKYVLSKSNTPYNK